LEEASSLRLLAFYVAGTICRKGRASKGERENDVPVLLPSSLNEKTNFYSSKFVSDCRKP
jgi:hypothetical protein